LDLGFLGDIADLVGVGLARGESEGSGLGAANSCLNAACAWDELLDFGEGLFQSLSGDVGHQDIGALLREENGGLETNASGDVSASDFRRR